jgi:O-antigen ligase
MSQPRPALAGSVPKQPVLDLSPRELLSALVSFEALFVLFLFAGRYKGDPRFAWVPVDLTVLFFLLSALAGMLILMRMRRIPRQGFAVVVAAVCFTVWMAASLAWTPGWAYAIEKTQRFAVLTLFALGAGALIIAPDPVRVRRFFLLIVMLGTWMATEALIYYVNAPSAWFIHVLGGSYLGLGRVCGLAALVVLAAWLLDRNGPVRHLLLLGLFATFCYVLLIGGGRGPLLATGLVLLVPLIVGLRLVPEGVLVKRFQFLLLGLILAGAAAITYLATSTELTMTLYRFMRLSGGIAHEHSAATRANRFMTTITSWERAPVFGHGIGSWPVLNGFPDEQHYVHNLFLELLEELGLIGLGLFLILMIVSLRPLTRARLRAEPMLLCALMLTINAFFNAMVTGDFNENRVLFTLFGILAMPAPQTARHAVSQAVPRDDHAQLRPSHA